MLVGQSLDVEGKRLIFKVLNSTGWFQALRWIWRQWNEGRYANCNGFRACVRKILNLARECAPDVLCLQEVRFATVWLGHVPKGWYWVQVDAEKKGYSSVAIWSRVEPVAVHRNIGLDWADREGRAVGMSLKTRSLEYLFSIQTSGDDLPSHKDEFLVQGPRRMFGTLKTRLCWSAET